MRRKLIGVLGAREPSHEEANLAYKVGKEVAKRGLALVTGGLGGVMEQASRGAADAGGLVIGILPTPDADQSNPFVEVSIATGMGDGRNAIIANTADVFIAVGGSFGTLSEIALALQRRKTVIALSTWSLDESRFSGESWHRAQNAAEAVQMAVSQLELT